MNLVATVAVLLLLLCTVSPSLALEKPLVLPIWPGAVPGEVGTFPPESDLHTSGVSLLSL